jgi:penicillin-binding protein 2
VAAKTGTAQKGSGISANGVFICYAPYDDPQVAIAVVVEHAGAGKSLAPIAKVHTDAYFRRARPPSGMPPKIRAYHC